MGELNKNGRQILTHKIKHVPVIYHEHSDEVCPLSKGEKRCPHEDDLGRPNFGENDGLDQVGKVPDLRKLAGCYRLVQNLRKIISLNGINGLKLPPGFSIDSLDADLGDYDEPRLPPPLPEGFHSANSALAGLRTDSGVGESIPGSVLTTGFHPFDSIGDDASSELAILNEDDELLDEVDIARPLPARTEFKRYENKKRLGLQFLTNVTPQQMATMAPSLRSSMDNFINQLELHMGVNNRNRHFFDLINFDEELLLL